MADVRITSMRLCARGGCGQRFEDPHYGMWPRIYCSPECHRIDKGLRAAASPRSGLRRAGGGERPRKPVSVASQAQRAKRGACIVTGDTECVDMAHCWPRSLGGCNDALCVIPLRRDMHRALDEGRVDVLPHMLAHGLVDELAHALVHARGDLVGLLERLTGERWAPVDEQWMADHPDGASSDDEWRSYHRAALCAALAGDR